MKEEQLRIYLENAYAHVPTLPGYWIDYEKFNGEFQRILKLHNEESVDAEVALNQIFPGYKQMEDFKAEDMTSPIKVIRLTPNKLKRISSLRKKLVENINKIPASADGWKDFAQLGQNDVKSSFLSLDFTTLKEVMETFFPSFYEFRKGDKLNHEIPLTFRSLRWQEDKQRNEVKVPVKHDANKTRKQQKPKLMEFALFLPCDKGFDAALKELAEKALPEQWYYGDDEHESLPILKSYLTYTFDRLCTEDEENAENNNWKKKIKESGDGRFCIFNTGLVDQLYDPIYAWFESNKKGKSAWIFKQFVKSSDKEMQTLTRIFGTDMPDTAHYYNSTSELVYDIRKQIGSYNWDHFILRCERLPLEFLRENGPEFDYDRSVKDKLFYADLSMASNYSAVGA